APSRRPDRGVGPFDDDPVAGVRGGAELGEADAAVDERASVGAIADPHAGRAVADDDPVERTDPVVESQASPAPRAVEIRKRRPAARPRRDVEAEIVLDLR